MYQNIIIPYLYEAQQHTAHNQEPKTVLAASGFSYVEGCWSCSWWTSNNLPRMKNQRLPVQF
jgi:hypothetical protein